EPGVVVGATEREAPWLAVAGVAGPEPGLLRSAEQQPGDAADVGDHEHEHQPHAFGQVAAQRRVGGDHVEDAIDPERKENDPDDSFRFEEHGLSSPWRSSHAACPTSST